MQRVTQAGVLGCDTGGLGGPYLTSRRLAFSLMSACMASPVATDGGVSVGDRGTLLPQGRDPQLFCLMRGQAWAVSAYSQTQSPMRLNGVLGLHWRC